MTGFWDAVLSPAGLMFVCQAGAVLATAVGAWLIGSARADAAAAARRAADDREAVGRLLAAVAGDRDRIRALHAKVVLLAEECRQHAREVELSLYPDMAPPGTAVAGGAERRTT